MMRSGMSAPSRLSFLQLVQLLAVDPEEGLADLLLLLELDSNGLILLPLELLLESPRDA